MNRPQTREETEKVVKGLTPRMVKARCGSFPLEEGMAPMLEAALRHGRWGPACPGGAAKWAERALTPRAQPCRRGEPGAHLYLSNSQPPTDLLERPPSKGRGARVGVQKKRVLTRRHPADAGLATRPHRYSRGSPTPALGTSACFPRLRQILTTMRPRNCPRPPGPFFPPSRQC